MVVAYKETYYVYAFSDIFLNNIDLVINKTKIYSVTCGRYKIFKYFHISKKMNLNVISMYFLE